MKLSIRGTTARATLDHPASVVKITNRDNSPITVVLLGTSEHRIQSEISAGEQATFDAAGFSEWELGEVVAYVLVSPRDREIPVLPAFELASGVHARDAVGLAVRS